MKQKNIKPISSITANLRRLALTLACGVALGLGLVITACTNQLTDDDIDLNPSAPALTIEVGTYPGYSGDGVDTRATAPLAPNETFTVNNTMWICISDESEKNADPNQYLKATTTDGKAWNFVTDATYDIALPKELDVTKKYWVVAYASACITGWDKTNDAPTYDNTKVGLYDVLYGEYIIKTGDVPAHKKIDFNGIFDYMGIDRPRLYHQYDRIRFTASAEDDKVTLTAAATVGYFRLVDDTDLTSTGTAITATAGTNRNVYFYGYWSDGVTITLKDKDGTPLFEATTTAGSGSHEIAKAKSYHFTN